MSATRDGRPGKRSRSAVFASVDAQSVLRDVRGTVAETVRRWSDPRERALRKRRRARRRATRFGVASGAGAVGTVTLAVASAPDWAVVATGGTAALFAVPAVLAVGTYRRLTAAPLPASAAARPPLPPAGSVARAPMERLAQAEHSLDRLSAVLGRSALVDVAELDHTGETARTAAAALRAVATDVVALEDAARSTHAAAPHLDRSIRAAVARLDDGVAQFEGLVTVAAKMTAPAQSPSYTLLDRQREELLSASERLEGWADALGEVGEIDRRFGR
ncbi:hypothetical protein [Prescottella sp. R16]|uniref:phage shock envelope stress response protein PspM n=1 Tax=Prescottella sp. R16 TaxID=3064529 RepID=UPI00272E5399|nr:hypothetical protein [Prescottella sp. R16]